MSDDKSKDVPKDLRGYSEKMPMAQEINQAVHRIDAAWPILKPIVAVVSNWRALLIIAAILAYIRGPDILNFIGALIGGAP